MKIGAIILCRYNSSRLPGKILMNLGGITILELIHQRISKVKTINEVIVATSDEISDDPIVQLCESKGFRCYRGDLNNVSKRFLDTAEYLNLDYAIRINGDNVLVDIPTLEDMVNIALPNKYTFISNVKNRTYPKGMSIEIVDVKKYAGLLKIYNTREYQEHVTLFYYEHEIEGCYFKYNTEYPELKGIQLALDTNEDFNFIQAIWDNFENNHTSYSLKEITSIIKKIKK